MAQFSTVRIIALLITQCGLSFSQNTQTLTLRFSPPLTPKALESLRINVRGIFSDDEVIVSSRSLSMDVLIAPGGATELAVEVSSNEFDTKIIRVFEMSDSPHELLLYPPYPPLVRVVLHRVAGKVAPGLIPEGEVAWIRVVDVHRGILSKDVRVENSSYEVQGLKRGRYVLALFTERDGRVRSIRRVEVQGQDVDADMTEGSSETNP